MSSQIMAVQLIQGSANIDRMRKEIADVVTMIFGLVTKLGELHHITKGQVELKGKGCIWEVSSTTSGRPCTDCVLLGKGLSYSSSGYFPTIDVQEVYESLDVFVQGMCNIIPGLKDQLRPFLKAAEKQF